MRSGRPGGASRRAAGCLLSALAAILPGCGSLPLLGHEGGASAGREQRPEAGPDYDVLVAEEHRRAGRKHEELEAWQRALAKDPESAYLHRKVAEGWLATARPDAALDYAQRAYELDPGDASNRLMLGNLQRLRGDIAEAERVLRGPDGKPFDRRSALLLHQILLEADRPEDSLTIAEELAREDAYSIEPLLALAASYQRLDREPEAEALLRRAIEMDPRNLRLRALLAHTLRERGDRDGEIAVFRELLAIEPHQHAALSALADAYVETQAVDAAIEAFEQIALHHPEDSRARLRLGLLYFERRRFPEAVAQLELFAAQSGRASPEIRFVLASARRRAGDVLGAAADFEQIPEQHKSYPDARLELASIYERRRDYARALAEVERVMALRPAPGLELYAATLRAKSGDVEGAVARVEQMLEQDPDNDELLYSLGLIFAEAGRSEEALRSMQRALEQNPDNANALNYVGYTFAERGERLDDSERMIARALELRPEDGYITDSLGWLYFMRAREHQREGRSALARSFAGRAREQLAKAAILTGGDPVISEHLGDIDLFEGDKAAALRRYEEALQQDPRPSEQPQLLEKLEQLRRELR